MDNFTATARERLARTDKHVTLIPIDSVSQLLQKFGVGKPPLECFENEYVFEGIQEFDKHIDVYMFIK